LRIILTTHVFLPDFRGGTETLVHDVARTLLRHGHEVIVVTGHPSTAAQDSGDRFDDYAVDSIRVARYRAPGRGEPGAGAAATRYIDLGFETAFRRLMREFDPDVVHFHHLKRLSVTAVDVCREARTPALLTVTDYWYVCPTQTLMLTDGRTCGGPEQDGANCLMHIATMNHRSDWATRVLSYMPASVIGAGMSALKSIETSFGGRAGDVQALAQRRDAIAERLSKLDRIFVPTRFTQDVMQKNGIVADRFRVLPFALGTEGYTKRVRRIGNGPLVLGFVGSLAPHKGVHVLLQAMKLLADTSRVELKVYGSAPAEADDYELGVRRVASADSRISFCGTFENRRMAEILDGLDALVIPSLWHENMPLIALSAQAAGCPLVASDVGGLADVVTHDKNGLVFAPGSSSELAELILRLLDDDLLARLSSHAIPPTDIEHYVGELELEYRGACERAN
jgi:glycosyltransferase involved in cell wall biosynthesis